MSALDEVDDATRDVLVRFAFDAERFEVLRRRVADGSLSPASNVVHGTVEPARPEDIARLPTGAGAADVENAGVAALRGGRVAHIVLAGGMATRFGGVVKAVVDVFPGRSFLDLALSATERTAGTLGATVPTVVMTSFATDTTVRAHLSGLPITEPLVFSQFVSLRLEPDGSLFRTADRSVSLYGPGHGDVFDALRSSGTLHHLRDRGVRHLCIANVDNLGARIDPLIIGTHVREGRPLTLEVAAKAKDAGGAPAWVDGRLRMVEGPAFPTDFDQTAIPVFNTNTAVVDVDALLEPVELSWLYVRKQVEGRAAVQLERVYHELSAFVPTTFLEVPRAGRGGRFLPVKEPGDLDAVRAQFAVLDGS